jgi:gamma-glutamyltranspeptidase / glutathione hydrolase
VPLPATGLLLLEAFGILKALDWPKLSAPDRLHAKLEALRIAWADRFTSFGDPDQVKVPVEKLLSRDYAAENAAKVTTALKAHKPVPLDVNPSLAGGTVNITTGDKHGNLIAITLTHGAGFGARVVVEELGIVLGHGMSRFDPRPGLPNSAAPRKRPITNMCPTVVTRGGAPVFAVGAAGGTKIPNSVYEVLLNVVGLGASLEEAQAAPRLDANGTLHLGLEKHHSAEDEAFFQKIGYTTKRVPSANVSAVAFDPKTKTARGLGRGP